MDFGPIQFLCVLWGDMATRYIPGATSVEVPLRDSDEVRRFRPLFYLMRTNIHRRLQARLCLILLKGLGHAWFFLDPTLYVVKATLKFRHHDGAGLCSLDSPRGCGFILKCLFCAHFITCKILQRDFLYGGIHGNGSHLERQKNLAIEQLPYGEANL